MVGAVAWKPASSLPAVAIQEFEEGLMTEAVEERCSQYGLETTTVVMGKKTCESSPHSKSHGLIVLLSSVAVGKVMITNHYIVCMNITITYYYCIMQCCC